MTDLFAQSGAERPPTFTMPIQGGMLEALGINMYTTLGKCLVEFLANAYDGEATRVDITIPIDRIATARVAIRAAAKRKVAQGEADPFTVLLEPLPDEITVTISDNGHGMTWQEVRDKFLPLNRKRRADDTGAENRLRSETGLRYVMGRKGLGKLAGFGAAERVEIRTKREGETYATLITLEDRVLKTAPNVTEVPVPATYEEGLNPTDHGTEIVLSALKTDAVRERADTLTETILEAFNAIRPEEVSIYLNGDLLAPKRPDYEFAYPETLDENGYALSSALVEDLGEISLKYYVGFLPRNQSLPARKRGARIYCNNRLAAGPSLLRLKTGMHSFHSVDYMECVVEADQLDRAGVDFINTNRSMLREDNELIQAVLDKVTDLMTEAVRAHGRFREAQAEEKLKTDPTGKVLSDIVRALPRKTRAPASKLLLTIASEFGVESPEFRDLAPAFINSVNATEVLVRLIHLRSDPETVARVAGHLRELSEMERLDVLKLYRGRRDGIAALKILWERGEEEWQKKGLEAELHNLLKNCPWLIRPEYSNYLSSDEDLNKTISKVAKELKVDKFAAVEDEGKEDERRPDLVFLMSDPALEGPFVINVIELKSPSIPLKIDHWRQVENYIYQIKRWCLAELPHTISVRGFLIGAMPAHNTSAAAQGQLLEKYREQGANAEIRIIGLHELIKDAWSVHIEAIRALETVGGDEEDAAEDNAIAAAAG